MSKLEEIKKLRDRTGISILQCKVALEKAGGDIDKAVEFLKSEGIKVSAKKADRNLGSGTIQSYIHAGARVGTLIELLCETDFVAKNPDFVSLAYDIAMQVAASDSETRDELLAEASIKSPTSTIESLITEAVQKFGERIEIGRFEKFSI